MSELINEAVANDIKLRKEIETDVYLLSDTMDPTGKNTTRYRNFFRAMSDDTFFKWAKNFFSNPRMNFTIAYEPIVDAKPFEFFEKAAETLGVTLWEPMVMPYLNGDTEDPVVTNGDVFIVELSVRRLFQMVNSKNSTSTSITNRNMETGQVKDSDKHARLTDTESYSLIAQNQDDAAIEYASMRADDMVQKAEYLTKIRNTGEVSLDDISNDELNKVSFNVLNYYMLASGFRTNLIDRAGLMLPSTIKNKEDRVQIKRGGEE